MRGESPPNGETPELSTQRGKSKGNVSGVERLRRPFETPDREPPDSQGLDGQGGGPAPLCSSCGGARASGHRSQGSTHSTQGFETPGYPEGGTVPTSKT